MVHARGKELQRQNGQNDLERWDFHSRLAGESTLRKIWNELRHGTSTNVPATRKRVRGTGRRKTGDPPVVVAMSSHELPRDTGSAPAVAASPERAATTATAAAAQRPSAPASAGRSESPHHEHEAVALTWAPAAHLEGLLAARSAANSGESGVRGATRGTTRGGRGAGRGRRDAVAASSAAGTHVPTARRFGLGPVLGPGLPDSVSGPTPLACLSALWNWRSGPLAPIQPNLRFPEYARRLRDELLRLLVEDGLGALETQHKGDAVAVVEALRDRIRRRDKAQRELMENAKEDACEAFFRQPPVADPGQGGSLGGGAGAAGPAGPHGSPGSSPDVHFLRAAQRRQVFFAYDGKLTYCGSEAGAPPDDRCFNCNCSGVTLLRCGVVATTANKTVNEAGSAVRDAFAPLLVGLPVTIHGGRATAAVSSLLSGEASSRGDGSTESAAGAAVLFSRAVFVGLLAAGPGDATPEQLPRLYNPASDNLEELDFFDSASAGDEASSCPVVVQLVRDTESGEPVSVGDMVVIARSSVRARAIETRRTR